MNGLMERLGKQAAAGSHCQSHQGGDSDQYQALDHDGNARNARRLGNEKDGGKLFSSAVRLPVG
jgi:hypothetical protein